ncbi:MAG: division/cell wall cluster transcriptional repressor MraZ [Roseinatronobacter sp.]
MFRGEFDLKVDAKGRVSIPSKFCRVIEACDPEWSEGKRANFVIVYGVENQCWLECHSVEGIREIEERIDLLQEGSPEHEDFVAKYISYAQDMQIDEDGRIVLPQKLRDRLGLDEDGRALFVSKGKHFEIWDRAKYEALKHADVRARAEERGPGFNLIVNLPKLPQR